MTTVVEKKTRGRGTEESGKRKRTRRGQYTMEILCKGFRPENRSNKEGQTWQRRDMAAAAAAAAEKTRDELRFC